MKLKPHLFDLIRTRVLAYLGHEPQLFRDPATVIRPGHIYRAYGYLIKAETLTAEEKSRITDLRQHPESAYITTSEGFTVTPPDPRCALCPLFAQGIPCREVSFECENFKYIIIKKPAHHE